MKVQRSDCLYQYNEAMQFSKIIDYLHTEGNLTKTKLEFLNTFAPFNQKSFYCWSDIPDDCFNHLIGLPTKDGVIHQLYDYEKQVYDTLQNQKYLWIKKATGLGITEFILRYMAWLAVQDNQYQNQITQFCIVTGPNIDLAIGLIKRFKALFTDKYDYIRFENDMTTASIGNIEVHAYPSHHLDSMRSLTNPKFIFLDEADMFKASEQQNARDVSERYIAKSDPFIVMVSTPNRPDGLFARMEVEQPCMYKRLYFSYHVGLGSIFTDEEIQKSKASPSFEREYNLRYLGKIGNVLSPYLIDKAVDLGERYKNTPINQYTIHSAGIDPGFSKITPLYITELDKEHGIIRVIYYEGFDNTITPEQIANRVHELHSQYVNLKWYVDGSNRGFINQLKTKFNENLNWNKPEDVYQNMNRIIPVNFVGNHKKMLEHMVLLVSAGKVAIPEKDTTV